MYSKNVHADPTAVIVPPLSAALLARRKREAQAKQAAALVARRESTNKPQCPFEAKRKGHQCRDLQCWKSELYAHSQPMGKVCVPTCVEFSCNGVHDRQARAKNVAQHKAERALKRSQWKQQSETKSAKFVKQYKERGDAMRASPCRFGKRCFKVDCIRQHPEGYLGPCSDMHHCSSQPALMSSSSPSKQENVCRKAHPPFELIGCCPACNQLVTIPNTREPLGCQA